MNARSWVTSNCRLAASQFQSALLALRPQMAAAAQKVYDSWDQSDEFDDHGGGGICDSVAQDIGMVIMNAIPGVETDDYGWEGDDHAAIVARLGQESFYVDIPAGVYETGGGYSWKKIPGVVIGPEDVVVSRL